MELCTLSIIHLAEEQLNNKGHEHQQARANPTKLQSDFSRFCGTAVTNFKNGGRSPNDIADPARDDRSERDEQGLGIRR